MAPTPWGTGGTCPPLLQMAWHGGTVSRRTTNKKLTKLYWPSQKRSPKRYCTFRAKEVEGHEQKIFFRRFAPNRCPYF